MIIIWSDEARVTYDKIIDELIENWKIDVVLDFEEKTNGLLNHLKIHKKLCPPSKRKRLRKCVIHKRVSLIYRINKSNIELVTFIANSTNHKY
ncbi:MAG: type II toxin-antitoxin system RelE/ParE family toxin [Flavobacteriales bacterium]|nr:type II toxin-antitoxin system RelE/ParE family toxin [Flavobacteriales bacterium]